LVAIVKLPTHFFFSSFLFYTTEEVISSHRGYKAFVPFCG